MNTESVSIIIPVYNSGQYLKRCLDSIIIQDYKNFDLIVVDGGSSDDSLDIVRSYSADINMTIISERDRGVYDAMNKGVRNAKGNWIYFLGSDDIFYDSTVLSDVFSKKYKEDIMFVYGNVKFLYSNLIYNGEFDYERILLGGNICHQAIFYRKELFDLIGEYDLECRIYADHDFNIRCFRNKRVKKMFIDRIIAVYNEEDGISTDRVDMAFRRKQNEYLLEYNKQPRQIMKNRVQKLKNLIKKVVQ